MKYKVGDKVKIKKELICGNHYGEFMFINDMKAYLDEEVVITEVLSDVAYKIDLDNSSWKWTDKMLEDVVPKFKKGDKVKFIKSVGTAPVSSYEKYLNCIFAIEGLRTEPVLRYDLEGISELEFDEEELQLVEIPVENFKHTNDSWLDKQYEILYFRGGNYTEEIILKGNVKTAKGTLINFDAPFTGRFFLKNENGGLEIIAMQSVVEMREIVS